MGVCCVVVGWGAGEGKCFVGQFQKVWHEIAKGPGRYLRFHTIE